MMPSTSIGKSSENKLDEMTKIIKNLSAKLNRLEMEHKNQNSKEGDRNANQFRRSFVPRVLPRERRNNDLKEKEGIIRIRGFDLFFKIK